MKKTNFQKIKEYGPLIISIILFIATMISLPTRVEQLESKTRTLEIQTAQSGAPSAAGSATTAATSSAPVDRDTLQGAVDRVQKAVETLSSAGIQFTLDQDFERMVVQVIDTSTKEVIRQIPPKEMLEIAQALDKLQGLLVHQKA